MSGTDGSMALEFEPNFAVKTDHDSDGASRESPGDGLRNRLPARYLGEGRPRGSR